MGKRQIFYDDNGKELSVYVQESNNLYIEIKDLNGLTSNITLSKEDAVLFILDLYRMKRLLIKE
jgi:hypothetical protein